MWCHVRHLNCADKNLKKITKKDKEIAGELNYNDVDFPVSKKDYGRIQMMNRINISAFCYENKSFLPSLFI